MYTRASASLFTLLTFKCMKLLVNKHLITIDVKQSRNIKQLHIRQTVWLIGTRGVARPPTCDLPTSIGTTDQLAYCTVTIGDYQHVQTGIRVTHQQLLPSVNKILARHKDRCIFHILRQRWDIASRVVWNKIYWTKLLN